MKKILLLLVLVSFGNLIRAQFPGYSKFYGYNASGNPKSCSIDALLLGENSQHLYFALNTNTNNTNNSSNSSKLVKTDIDGNIEFQLFDSVQGMSTVYKSILMSQDGGYIYWFGNTVAIGGVNNLPKLKVVKTDLELNKVWEKLYPLNGSQSKAISIKKGTGNNILILYNDNPNNMMRLDSAGAVLDFYTVASGSGEFTSFVNTDENGIIIAAHNSIFSYDSLIAPQWNNAFITPPTTRQFRACLRSNDTSETYYAAGLSIQMEYSNPNWDIATFSGTVVKHDDNGNPKWFKVLPIGCVQITDVGPGADFFKYMGYQSIVNTLGNGCAVAGGGSSDPILWQQYKGIIARLDSNGNEMWNYLYKITGIEHQALNNIVSLPDGSFIASGFADSSAIGTSRMGWLLRVDSTGCYNPACSGIETPEPCPTVSVKSIEKTDINVSVFPNPATTQINIQLGLAFGKDSWMEVRDILGKTIVEPVSLVQKKQYTFDVSKWTNGNYFLRFKMGDQLYYQKLLCFISPSK